MIAVVTADVIGSRASDNFTDLRDAALERASELHLGKQRIAAPYTVTTWDEFQTAIPDPSTFPAIVFDLRRIFHPLALRIGVGIGAAHEPVRTPINVFAGGEAFELARSALDSLKAPESPSKPRGLTCVRSANPLLERTCNLVYALHDTLLAGISPKQWEAIQAYAGTGSQEAAAKQLELDKSTVSRTLQRAFYSQLELTVNELGAIIRDIL